jgi:hypothetical protein
MSLQITITTHPDYGKSGPQVEDALAAIGFARITGTAGSHAHSYVAPAPDTPATTSAPEVKEEEPTADEPRRRRGRPPKAETEAAAISTTPENRVDPDNPETAEQDAADEAAEVEANRKELTVDDVKALAMQYQDAYGIPAVQEDGAKIFVEALGAPPAGQAFWKFSILPTDQESLRKLVDVWARALEENPLKRAKVK